MKTPTAVEKPCADTVEAGKRLREVMRENARLRAELAEQSKDLDRLDRAAESADQAGWEYDVPKQTMTVSRKFVSMLGYSEADEVDMTTCFAQCVDPSDCADQQDIWNAFICGQTERYRSEMRILCRSGVTQWWLFRAVADRDEAGRAVRVVGSACDISRRHRAEAALNQSADRHRTLFESLPLPMYVVDPLTLRFVDINIAMTEQYGYTREEFLQMTVLDIRPPDYMPAVKEAIEKFMGRKTGYVGVWRHMRKDGTQFSAEITATTLEYPNEPPTILVMADDITERMRAQVALEQSERRLSGLFDNASEGIYQITPEGRFLRVNPSLARMLGYDSPETMISETMYGSRSLYVQPDRRDELAKRMLAEGRVDDFVSEARRRDHTVIWISENARCVRGPSSEVLYFEGFVENVTDRIATEAERERHLQEALASADRDPLTGLLNHRAFHKRLGDEVERAQRLGSSIAVIMLDLDNFKFFNDAYGHAAGDEVLRTVASNLRTCCRSYDILARFGGDEFAIVMPESSIDGAANFAARLRSSMQESGFQPEGYDAKIPLCVSIGVALYPDEVPTRSEIIELADQRLLRAKAGNEMDSVCDRMRANYLSSISGFKILDALVTAVDNKDRYTRKHSEDVMLYSQQIASELNLDNETMDLIQLTALLHDVGKVGVPDSILRKPGRLTEEETAAIQQHAVMGAMIVSAVPGFVATLDGIRHHHERWDGKGYPDGLAGDATPRIARILSVADAFSAMTTNRPYRTSMPQKRALKILEDGAGTQWDPACVMAFLKARGVAARTSGLRDLG